MPATPDATRLCMPAGQQACRLNFGAFIKDPTDTAASETHINLAEWRKSVIVERRWVPENSRGMPLCVEGMRLTMRPLDKANHDAGWRFELADNIEIYVDTPTDTLKDSPMKRDDDSQPMVLDTETHTGRPRDRYPVLG